MIICAMPSESRIRGGCKMQENNVDVIFDAISENESFARVVAAAFVTRLDPTLEEISDIKTAVSEAVTNSIVHGYEGKGGHSCFLLFALFPSCFVLFVEGVSNIGIHGTHPRISQI